MCFVCFFFVRVFMFCLFLFVRFLFFFVLCVRVCVSVYVIYKMLCFHAHDLEYPPTLVWEGEFRVFNLTHVSTFFFFKLKKMVIFFSVTLALRGRGVIPMIVTYVLRLGVTGKNPGHSRPIPL